MNTPLIIICGNAGAGKDTAAAYLKEKYNAGTLALADPMKQFVYKVFGFTEDQVWGPSELRNESVRFDRDRTITNYDNFSRAFDNFIESVVPAKFWADGSRSLSEWFNRYGRTIGAEHYVTPRLLLQTLGTEWGRKIDPDMWVNATIKDALRLLNGGCFYSRTEGVIADPTTNYDYAVISDGRFRSEIVGVLAKNGVTMKITRPGPTKLVGIAGHQSEKELGGIPDHLYDSVLENESTFENLYHQIGTEMAINFGDCRTKAA